MKRRRQSRKDRRSEVLGRNEKVLQNHASSIPVLFPVPTMAGVDVSISLPPLIAFSAPPAMVVIPETYVYVVPDVEAEIFFYDGWWWRPWEGRWYRSRHYDSGWGYYQRVPSFYSRVPSGWRNDYRERRWGGRPWNYKPIPHHQVERNWSGWKKNRHWEKQQTWGVQGLRPRTQSRPASHAVQQDPSETATPGFQTQRRWQAPPPSNRHIQNPPKGQGTHDKGDGKPTRRREKQIKVV